MSNQLPDQPPERSFYEFLRNLLLHNRSSTDSTGLIAYVATLGFFALIFTTFMTLVVVKANNPPSAQSTTITNTQGGSTQAR
jgi:hypothetical protein